MALNDITIADGGNQVYSVVGWGSSMSANRRLITSTLSTPEDLIISHELGSQTRPDRHLFKMLRTEQDANDTTLFQTASVHTVCSLPRTVNSVEDIVDLYRRSHIYLYGGTAAYDNLRALCRGNLG